MNRLISSLSCKRLGLLSLVSLIILFFVSDDAALILVHLQEKTFKYYGTATLSAKKLPWDSVWLPLQEALCRHGIPNTTLGETLFILARKELAEATEDDTWTTEEPVNKAMAKQFYTGFFPYHSGISLYTEKLPQGGNLTLLHVIIWKCGSEFIRLWQEHVFGNRVQGEFHEKLHSKVASAMLYERGLTNPCIVTAVRDPIDHFLSGYNEVECRVDNFPERKSMSRAPPAFLFLPNATDEERQLRFTEFVHNVLYERFRSFNGLEENHFMSMARVRSGLAELGWNITAYLPTLKDLSNRWPEFLEESCPGLVDLPRDAGGPDVIGGTHTSSLDRAGYLESARAVWSQQGPVARALCALHAMDYACWDQLPDGIPPLCQEVYRGKSFADGILNT